MDGQQNQRYGSQGLALLISVEKLQNGALFF
jgi:hypothetical protein